MPTPNQPAIHNALFKKAGKMKKTLIDMICNQKQSLHFDGNYIDRNENQAVLKNKASEMKLAVLNLYDGRLRQLQKD